MASRNAPSRRLPKGEYIETDTGNKISRRARIEGTSHITLGGRTVIQAEACLRGDLHRFSSTSADHSAISGGKEGSSSSSSSTTSIVIGKYTVLSPNCIIHPPSRLHRGVHTYYPIKIGDHVFIGPNAVIMAASIGSHVYIGEGAVLENGCIVKESAKVLEGAVVPAGMVIASGSVVGGRPARTVGDLPEGWGQGSSDQGWVEGGELRELVKSIR